MKPLSAILPVMIYIIFSHISLHAQVVFSENFEDVSGRNQWKLDEYVIGSESWRFAKGGYVSYPPYAANGSYNALFQKQSLSGETTKLVSPSIDLASEQHYKLELRFWHSQMNWNGNNDELSVFYKKNTDSNWIKLNSYSQEIIGWVQQIILLPDSAYTNDFYIAFEGKTNWGYGVCIDSIEIVETGIIERYVNNIEISQPETGFVATGTINNIIAKIKINIQGNHNNIILDSLALNSLNTTDADVKDNGVKIYYTTVDEFGTNAPLATGVNFINGMASFNGLNKILPTGNSFIWITYDIDSNAIQGNFIDMQFLANSIKINTNYYPLANKSPSGNRIIYSTIFFDDFEIDNGWYLKADFERAIPLGKGGSIGNPDPSNANSGNYIIGTDITSDGDYELGLGDTAYYALSPLIDLSYYKDIQLSFKRWLNIDWTTYARIMLSNSAGASWIPYWVNTNESWIISDNKWKQMSYDVNTQLQRKSQVYIMFSLGEGWSSYNKYSGWNIDDVILIGDYIARDVGISDIISPVDGCGFGETEEIIIEVTNYGGEASPAAIPVFYSFDNNITRYYDTIYQSIPFKGSIEYTFKPKYNLSQAGYYTLRTGTLLANDEDNSNNNFNKSILILPTKNLPYSEDFESDETFWLNYGVNSSWNIGNPSGAEISKAASGAKAWATNLWGDYYNNETSYVESPCFNFSGSNKPLFEMKTYRQMESNTDGGYMLFSTDCGSTWDTLGNYGEPYNDLWNWYNSDSIGTDGFNGWTGVTDRWVYTRKLLPPEIIGAACVQFRVVFKSNSDSTMEGFAFDDVKIYEAPPDVGVDTVFLPVGACELSKTEQIKVRIKNYGIDPLPEDFKIPLGVIIDNNPVKYDTLALLSELPVGATIEYILKPTGDFSVSKEYALKVYTNLADDYSIYHSKTNDTAFYTVLNYGLSEFSLGHDIGSKQPDTLILNAGPELKTYLWNDDPDSIFQVFHVPAEGKYWVEVSNDSGCIARDTLEVFLSNADLSVIDKVNLFSACEINTLFYPEIKLTNIGPDSLFNGEIIEIAYCVNNMPVLRDSIIVTDTILPDSIFSYTFTKGVDISEPDIYYFSFYTQYTGDINLANDTLVEIMEVYGLPEVNLGIDTIYTTAADTLLLNAGEGFATYCWQDGSDKQTYAVSDNSTQQYKVTVTDIYGCGSATDSIQIISYDIGVSEIISPVSNCELTKTEAFIVKVKNFGYDTLPEGLPVNLNLAIKGLDTSVIFNLNSKLFPGGSVNYTLENTFDFTSYGTKTVSAETYWILDVNPYNNKVTQSVNEYGFPIFNLGPDTVLTNAPTTITLNTAPGYNSYLWQNGDTTQDLKITNPASYMYHVTVSNDFGCNTADTIYVINFDVGMVGIENPLSDCRLSDSEPVIVRFANYCHDIINAGDSIRIGLIFNSDTVEETHVFTNLLNPGEEALHEFNYTADVSSIGNYKFEAYTRSPLDITKNNNTLSTTIYKWEGPDVDFALPDTIHTIRPDTLQFDAGGGFRTYTWQNNSKTSLFNVVSPNSQQYKVTVTDIHGCKDADSVYVNTRNIGIINIKSPVNCCVLTNAEEVSLYLINSGHDIIEAGTTLKVFISIEDIISYEQNYTLTSNLTHNDSILIALSGKFDFSKTAVYNIKIWAGFALDAYINDTLHTTIGVYGYPEISLGETDSIYTSQPDTIILNPGAGYSTYKWNNGTTGSTLQLTELNSKWYSVTVANEIGCETVDSIYILSTDIGISKIVSPVSGCKLTDKEIIGLYVKNYCHDTLLPGELVTVNYLVDGNNENQVVTLSDTLLPDSVVLIQSSSFYNFLAVNDYELNIEVDYSRDKNTTNNLINQTISVYGLPMIDLGPDTIYSAQANTIVLTAESGFSSYLWNDNSTLAQLQITKPEPALYSLTVTDDNNCSNSDSVRIISYDLEVSDIYLPINNCQLSTEENISFSIRNKGQEILPKGMIIDVQMFINKKEKDTSITLLQPLYSGESRDFDYISTYNLSVKGVYSFTLIANISFDYNALNDTIRNRTVSYGFPEVKFKDEKNNKIEIELPYKLELINSYTSYLWHDGKTAKSYDVKQSGYHSVTVTDENNCSNSAKVFVSVKNADLLVAPETSLFEIYPNPSSGMLFIKTSGLNDIFTIEIINNSGLIMFQREYNVYEKIIEIDVSLFKTGIYLMRIYNDNALYVYPIMLL